MRSEGGEDTLYRSGPMAEGHPVLATAHLEWYVSTLEKMPDERALALTQLGHGIVMLKRSAF